MKALKLTLFSTMLAMGGLPLYVHLPQYVSQNFEIQLSILGVMFLAFRALDMIQDPLLGRFIDTHPKQVKLISIIASFVMAIGYLGTFTFHPSQYQLIWLIIFVGFIFTGYSTLNIILYRETSQLQNTTMPQAARTRELGLLIGVIIGSVLPMLISALGLDAYAVYGICLGAFAIIATVFVSSLWDGVIEDTPLITISQLYNIGGMRILALVFLNSLPVAITSTLFLFFVSDRLQMPNLSAAFLSIFFIGTMIGVAVFSKISENYAHRQILIITMICAAFVFLWAFFLPQGAAIRFAFISFLSGIFLGAELYILPVMFANLLRKNNFQTGAAFGYWSFMGKLGLAFAAALVLPMLSYFGYSATNNNSKMALTALAASYAFLPSLIKLGAIALTIQLPKQGY